MKKSTSHSIGNLVHSKKTDSGIEGVTEGGRIRVIVFSDEIVKISLTRDEFDDFSYAVVASPVPTDFKFHEDESSVRITTKKFRIIVNKLPARIRFETLDNQVINEDEPGLYTSWIGDQVTAYKKLQNGERFIGLGEKTGPLDRKGAAYQNWNSDAYGYHGGSDPLYCSTPFYTGIHHDLVYGIFFDNSHKTFFNFGASNNRFASFSADYGVMNYFFIHDSSINRLIEHYTWLTGRMELPPRWSLGFQQCRYSYYPDTEVLAVARTFREKDIPADVIVLDIHYMDRYKIFTWDPKNFPNPKELIRSLRELGFQVVVMCDPGIKIEEGYEPYDDGKKENVFLKYPDGENYAGQVWPGWCHFPDFTNPKTRAWWQDKLEQYVNLGLSGFWNDMNEIATWGHALPENLEFDFEGNTSTSRRGRNVYGFQMARSTYEGTKKLLKGKRPFNLTRSGFSGVQRYGAVWTGDNVSYDEHMLLGVRLVNSMGLTGIAFAGYDAGGFVGESNTKLFARWISVAALSPFFRGHTMMNTRDSEPWSYGEEVEQIARNFIKLRYQLMPYIYSLFHEAAESGMPVQRSLAIDFPFHSKVFDHAFHNQYLFGPYILVAPVESSKEVVKVFFPEGEWYSIYTGKVYQGEQEAFIECPVHKIPVFVRGGGIVPMKKSGKNSGSETEELLLHVYAGSRSSDFLLYEDDGETFNYQNGEFARRLISFQPGKQKLILSPNEGAYQLSWKKLRIVYHGFARFDKISVNNRDIAVVPAEHSFFTPLEKYDPINEPGSMGSEKVQIADFPYDENELVITW